MQKGDAEDDVILDGRSGIIIDYMLWLKNCSSTVKALRLSSLQ